MINSLSAAVKATPVEAYSDLVTAVTADPMDADSQSNDMVEYRASISVFPARTPVIDVPALSAKRPG